MQEFRFNKSKINLIKSLFLFSLACYTKQFYVFIFIYILLLVYKKLLLKEFFLILLYLTILGLPGLLFTIKNPLLLLGLSQDVTNFSSTILISGSIMFFYLIPFIIQYVKNKINENKEFKDFYNYKRLIFSLTVVIILSFSFKYDSDVGGGVFLKISNIIFENNMLLFLTSVLGIYFLFYFCEENFESILLVILLLITFSSGILYFKNILNQCFL